MGANTKTKANAATVITHFLLSIRSRFSVLPAPAFKFFTHMNKRIITFFLYHNICRFPFTTN